jgi:LmbE family N-acetylglucosaminyl deacetylase
MLRFTPGKDRNGALELLCIGAHGDDLEIGCGGTILRLAEEFPGLSVTWVVLSADERRARETRSSASELLEAVRAKRIAVEGFRDGFFPSSIGEIKEYFERLKRSVAPDLVFTHFGGDAHQDHRIVCELTWNTWRDHAVFEYEIPKYDGDLGRPNIFVPLDETLARKKVSLITRHFESQSHRPWFAEDVFLSLMRLRGIEARSAGGYAEAFYCRKLVV